MENEGNENIINLNQTFEQDNIFILDYSEQDPSNKKIYQIWNESMLKKYGNDAKLFRCIQDKILFYVSYDDCIDDPSFKCDCPICGNKICLFCSGNDTLNVICCYKRLIYNSLFHDGFLFIKKVDKNKDIQLLSNDLSSLFIFIPGLHLFIFNFIFVNKTLFALTTKAVNYDDKGERQTYLYRFQKNCFNYIIIYLFALMTFLNSIYFFILDFYFILFLLLISILFKFYPLKYYLGIISSSI